MAEETRLGADGEIASLVERRSLASTATLA
jgi:hypothetical protein